MLIFFALCRRITIVCTALSFACGPAGEVSGDGPSVPGSHLCADGTVIDQAKLCDKTQDCRDGSDENSVLCRGKGCEPGFFPCANGSCIPVQGLCNGRNECPGREDEAHCGKTCGTGMYACADGTCKPSATWCDKTPDCPGKEDESMCKMEAPVCAGITCSNGATCITIDKVCNGVPDCTNKEDEPSTCKGSTPASCGGVPAAPGRCKDGRTREWCDGGAVKTETCTGDNTCQAPSGAPTCLSPSGSAPCGDAPTAPGRCKNTSTREWCDGGTLKTETCTGGKICSGSTGAAMCAAPTSGCPADLNGFFGKCTADGMGFTYCQTAKNMPVTVDCRENPGTTCKKDSDGYAQCLTSMTSTTECDALGWNGKCDADGFGYRWCKSGTIVTERCPVSETCAGGTSTTAATCQSAASSCGGIGPEGQCDADGRGVTYCEDETFQYYACAAEQTCEWDGFYYRCADDTCDEVNWDQGTCKAGGIVVRCTYGTLEAHKCDDGCRIDDSGTANCVSYF